MGSSGIEGLLIQTHNWGKSVAFWQELGFNLEFETDHHSGQLRHPKGGPFIFLAEIAPDDGAQIHPIVAIDDAGEFEPPQAGTVERAFVSQHWDVKEMLVRDPDGRIVSIQAPSAT